VPDALCLILALFLPFLATAQERAVALTFDDVPASSAIDKGILATLKKHHAAATAFVIQANCEKLGQATCRPILEAWTSAGHELGNHTYSHADFNDLTLLQFQDQVQKGEASLGPKPRHFRFPFNHAGDTPEKQSAAMDYLKARGYSLATCTIDNSDYEFSRPYSLFLARKDSASAARLRSEYLAYTAAEIDYYSALHRQIFGREIPHVMLLHDNQLNADVLDQILELFEARQYRFVSLDQAQSDKAYSTPIPQATRFGPMWAYRWARALGIKVDGKLEPEPPSWILQTK
jgi:peptidoglycan/xylan/chitin deacetylase (PgdA/CDA1 family)